MACWVELPCWAVAIELITPKASVAAAIVQKRHRMKSSLYHLLTNSLPTGRREGGFWGTQQWRNNSRRSAIGPTAPGGRQATYAYNGNSIHRRRSDARRSMMSLPASSHT